MRSSGPALVGIVNITEDSFSDGGQFLAPEKALSHARDLVARGADVIELGPASSHPDSADVTAAEERARLEPVTAALLEDGASLSVDSYLPETQLWCAASGFDYINDISGFPDEAVRKELASQSCKLVVMHSIQDAGRATREETSASEVLQGIHDFFTERIAELETDGVSRERLILDPGMGFFLGSTPEPSLLALRDIAGLKAAFGLPVLISVSRKSFLGKLTGRMREDRGPATLAAELFAAREGADYLRTHDVGAVADGLAVNRALEGQSRESCTT